MGGDSFSRSRPRRVCRLGTIQATNTRGFQSSRQERELALCSGWGEASVPQGPDLNSGVKSWANSPAKAPDESQGTRD